LAASRKTSIGGRELAADPAFAADMKSASGTDFSLCFQCLTCTLGCPMSWAMDYPPNEIIRLVQHGLGEEVLSSVSIQICSACETCVTRCPNGIKIADLVDALRVRAFERDLPTREPNVRKFHRSFLGGFRNYGRLHEIGFVMMLKLRTLNLFQDAWVGARMFFKGKFSILPHRIKGRDQVKEIFRKTLDSGRGGRG
jgi:heterodisulfide reductase subunit C